jgi:hypothetical protein
MAPFPVFGLRLVRRLVPAAHGGYPLENHVGQRRGTASWQAQLAKTGPGRISMRDSVHAATLCKRSLPRQTEQLF